MPETVLTIFQEAIDSANKGIINWIFKHRGMKLLSVLSLPYTLPADMMHATFTKYVLCYFLNQLPICQLIKLIVKIVICKKAFLYKYF